MSASSAAGRDTGPPTAAGRRAAVPPCCTHNGLAAAPLCHPCAIYACWSLRVRALLAHIWTPPCPCTARSLTAGWVSSLAYVPVRSDRQHAGGGPTKQPSRGDPTASCAAAQLGRAQGQPAGQAAHGDKAGQHPGPVDGAAAAATKGAGRAVVRAQECWSVDWHHRRSWCGAGQVGLGQLRCSGRGSSH